MRARLLLGFLVFAALAIAALEIPLGFTLEARNRTAALAEAQRGASSLAVVMDEELEAHDGSRAPEIARRYASSIAGDVVVARGSTVLAAGGKSGAEELTDPGIPPIIAAARRGRVSGVDPAREDGGDSFLYVAMPLASRSASASEVTVMLVASPAGPMNAAIRNDWLELAGFGLVVLLVAAVVGTVLSRSLTRPLLRIGAAVASLGEGDLDARAPVEVSPPELHDLAVTVNTMATQLGELLEAQRSFVADASHQLRTPLTALRLRLENLERKRLLPDAAGSDALLDELDRLSRLVDGLLALARAEGRRPERVVVDAAAVARERCGAWRPLAQEQGVELATIADGPLPALACPGYLEQMLDNLLANAFEAAPKGSTVEVCALASDNLVEVHVSDAGPGMSEEDRVRAFKRFWRPDGAGASGSGLGLAIVEQLARVCGGSIELLEAPGGGIDAVVTLQRS